MFKYEAFSSPNFPKPGLNTEIYRVNVCIQSEYGKYGPEKTRYLDTFHGVITRMYFTRFRLKWLCFYNAFEKDIDLYLLWDLSTMF